MAEPSQGRPRDRSNGNEPQPATQARPAARAAPEAARDLALHRLGDDLMACLTTAAVISYSLSPGPRLRTLTSLFWRPTETEMAESPGFRVGRGAWAGSRK